MSLIQYQEDCVQPLSDHLPLHLAWHNGSLTFSPSWRGWMRLRMNQTPSRTRGPTASSGNEGGSVSESLQFRNARFLLAHDDKFYSALCGVSAPRRPAFSGARNTMVRVIS